MTYNVINRSSASCAPGTKYQRLGGSSRLDACTTQKQTYMVSSHLAGVQEGARPTRRVDMLCPSKQAAIVTEHPLLSIKQHFHGQQKHYQQCTVIRRAKYAARQRYRHQTHMYSSRACHPWLHFMAPPKRTLSVGFAALAAHGADRGRNNQQRSVGVEPERAPRARSRRPGRAWR